MSLHYADDWLTVYHGDALTELRTMEPESVHCVVTSPPYWGLRDYGTATWEGGDPECDHSKDRSLGIASSGLEGGKGTTNHQQEAAYRGVCGKCAARRIDAQLGLEPTPEEYVDRMVEVFREVRRVLRKDGTLWLNLGDTYATDRGGTPQPAETLAGGEHGIGPSEAHRGRGGGYSPARDARAIGLKGKDLVGIPWRVAFALQADGWYLRSDIIWAKPNPMPESVTDRPTKSHEYLFLLSKSPRYYYDAEAVREAEIKGDAGSTFTDGKTAINLGGRQQSAESRIKTKKPDGWATHSGGHGSFHRDGREAGEPGEMRSGRNLRSVWTVATQPYPGAHFATFPRKLVEPCIKAGCPEGGTVLDPFAGSGTTGMVAQGLGRRAVLIDLSLDYLGQLMNRNAQTPLGLAG